MDEFSGLVDVGFVAGSGRENAASSIASACHETCMALGHFGDGDGDSFNFALSDGRRLHNGDTVNAYAGRTPTNWCTAPNCDGWYKAKCHCCPAGATNCNLGAPHNRDYHEWCASQDQYSGCPYTLSGGSCSVTGTPHNAAGGTYCSNPEDALCTTSAIMAVQYEFNRASISDQTSQISTSVSTHTCGSLTCNADEYCENGISCKPCASTDASMIRLGCGAGGVGVSITRNLSRVLDKIKGFYWVKVEPNYATENPFTVLQSEAISNQIYNMRSTSSNFNSPFAGTGTKPTHFILPLDAFDTDSTVQTNLHIYSVLQIPDANEYAYYQMVLYEPIECLAHEYYDPQWKMLFRKKVRFVVSIASSGRVLKYFYDGDTTPAGEIQNITEPLYNSFDCIFKNGDTVRIHLQEGYVEKIDPQNSNRPFYDTISECHTKTSDCNLNPSQCNGEAGCEVLPSDFAGGQTGTFCINKPPSNCGASNLQNDPDACRAVSDGNAGCEYVSTKPYYTAKIENVTTGGITTTYNSSNMSNMPASIEAVLTGVQGIPDEEISVTIVLGSSEYIIKFRNKSVPEIDETERPIFIVPTSREGGFDWYDYSIFEWASGTSEINRSEQADVVSYDEKSNVIISIKITNSGEDNYFYFKNRADTTTICEPCLNLEETMCPHSEHVLIGCQNHHKGKCDTCIGGSSSGAPINCSFEQYRSEQYMPIRPKEKTACNALEAKNIAKWFEPTDTPRPAGSPLFNSNDGVCCPMMPEEFITDYNQAARPDCYTIFRPDSVAPNGSSPQQFTGNNNSGNSGSNYGGSNYDINNPPPITGFSAKILPDFVSARPARLSDWARCRPPYPPRCALPRAIRAEPPVGVEVCDPRPNYLPSRPIQVIFYEQAGANSNIYTNKFADGFRYNSSAGYSHTDCTSCNAGQCIERTSENGRFRYDRRHNTMSGTDAAYSSRTGSLMDIKQFELFPFTQLILCLPNQKQVIIKNTSERVAMHSMRTYIRSTDTITKYQIKPWLPLRYRRYSSSSTSSMSVCDVPNITCGTGEYKDNNRCRPVTTCDSSEYEVSAPSETSDRVCANITACPPGHYISTPATSTSNNICSAYTRCHTDNYLVQAGTATTDNVCAPLYQCNNADRTVESSQCDNTPVMDASGNRTNNHTCKCRPEDLSATPPTRGSYRAGQECQSGPCNEHTGCSSSEFLFIPGTSSTDNICYTLNDCSDDDVVSSDCNTSDKSHVNARNAFGDRLQDNKCKCIPGLLSSYGNSECHSSYCVCDSCMIDDDPQLNQYEFGYITVPGSEQDIKGCGYSNRHLEVETTPLPPGQPVLSSWGEGAPDGITLSDKWSSVYNEYGEMNVTEYNALGCSQVLQAEEVVMKD